MAIDKKVPSPNEVKNSPTQFTSSELEEIKNLKNSISDTTFKFGQVSISKIKIQEQEDFLKNQLNSLNQEEVKVAKNLTDKYGKGSLNTETGEFIPVE